MLKSFGQPEKWVGCCGGADYGGLLILSDKCLFA